MPHVFDANPPILDITATMGVEAPSWEGDPGFEHEVDDARSGGGSMVSRLAFGVHHGTHVDAPAHFVPGGAMLEAYPLERFLLPAEVIDAGGAVAITPEHVERSQVRPGGALLFRTENSNRQLMHSPTFTRDFVAMSLPAAQKAVEMGAGMVGCDYLSIEAFGSEGHPVHMTLLGAEVLILEGLDLTSVTPGSYFLLCQPLKLSGAEASPVRALLLPAR
ncbi:MAG: cyclase family protein [Phycisphaerae bacterium]